MKKQYFISMAALFLAFILVLPSAAASISDAKSEKKELEESLEGIKGTLNNLKGSISSIENHIVELDGELNELSDNLNQLSEDLEVKEQELEETKVQLEEARETEEKQYEAMKKRIKFMYEKGNTAYIELILNSGSISELLNKAEYITQISDYDRNMLIKYQETKELIAQKEMEIEQECIVIEEMQKEVSAQQQSVEALINQKSAEIEKYEAEIESTQVLADEYEAEIAEQNAIIKQLEAQAAAERKRKEEAAAEAKRKAEEAKANGETVEEPVTTDPVAYDGGQFTWPCPSSKRITSDYGYRMHPTLGVEKFHDGIDIGASAGAAIVAAYDGTVAGAGYNATMGNYVLLDHGNGLYTIYMHASSLLVSSGQNVSRGATIALVGSTGRSTGPHLHFGVRLNGSYVSPWNYVG